jgi:hypothetical protein
MDTQTVAVKDARSELRERKAQLVRQGEFYRVGVVHAKAQVRHAARPEALFHSAMDHATWAVRARVDSLLHPTGASVASVMPYVLSIVGFIRRRRMGKAALGTAVLLAGVGWYLQQRRTGQVAD